MNVLLGKKIGVTRVFGEDGKELVVTVLDVTGNIMTKHISDGTKVTHFEVGKDKMKRPSKSLRGEYKNLRYVPRFRKVFKIHSQSEEDLKPIGEEIKVDDFGIGDSVHVSGITKGKGFQGVVKRWGFSGGPRTHGQSDRERAPGSIGSGTTPGRVHKGKKMPGTMGNIQHTTKNLKVVKIIPEEGIMAVSGPVPGNMGSYIVIVKK